MRLVQLTRSSLVVAQYFARPVAIAPETARLLACNVRPTTSLCRCDWINPIGGVGSSFNYLAVNKDRRINWDEI